jgi:large repetitive protein
VVPDTQVGGANRDRRFWVRQISAPAGWLANPTLEVGSVANPPLRPSTYQFQTPLQLRSGQIYDAGALATQERRFMTDLGPTVPTSSSGIWQDSRAEPTPNASCDVHIALALDVTSDNLDRVKTAADATVAALGSMRYLTASVSLYPFAGAAPPVGDADRLNLPIHSATDVQSAQRIIDALGQGTGGSNWDAVLEHIAGAAQHYDLAGVITGIGPTAVFAPPQGSPGVMRFVNMEFAAFAANALKAEGTWVGADTVQPVTPGSVEANLVAISGPAPHQDWFSQGSQEGHSRTRWRR